jgi:heptosyltransferase-2
MPKRILIRGVNWLGDAVMTMPAIREVRKAYPEAHIALLVKPWVAPVFEKDPNINEIILYEETHKGFFGKFRLSSLLRQKKFDMAILLQNAFDAALTVFLAGIPERIGYDRDSRGWMLTKAISFKGDDRKIHHIDYYIELLNKAGINAKPSEPWIYLSLNERIKAREEFRNLRRPIIGINPGAKFGSAKMWLPDRFALIAKHVIKNLDGSAVIFGGPGEKEIETGILSHLGDDIKEHILPLAGATSLRELCAYLSECDAMISNDSGPMHVGYALHTPLVAIFGSTSYELTGPPENSDNTVLSASIPCVPCFERKCPDGTLKCMQAISASDAITAIESILPTERAVFFDRDGTLCEDAHYLNSWDKLNVFDDISSLNILSDKGFKLVGVSNQSGIARGIVEEKFVLDVHSKFKEKYGFLDFYHCPHHPNEGCTCRKPEPEMLFKARQEHGIDLKRSYMVGDKDDDMLLAKHAGATGILVQTGKQQHSIHADHTARNLEEVVSTIIALEENR